MQPARNIWIINPFLFSWLLSFLVQFLKKEEDIFEVRRTISDITNDPIFIDDDRPPSKDRITLVPGKASPEIVTQKPCYIG